MLSHADDSQRDNPMATLEQVPTNGCQVDQSFHAGESTTDHCKSCPTCPKIENGSDRKQSKAKTKNPSQVQTSINTFFARKSKQPKAKSRPPRLQARPAFEISLVPNLQCQPTYPQSLHPCQSLLLYIAALFPRSDTMLDVQKSLSQHTKLHSTWIRLPHRHRMPPSASAHKSRKLSLLIL